MTFNFWQLLIIVIGPKNLRNTNQILALDGIILFSSSRVRNLGVIFDQIMSVNGTTNIKDYFHSFAQYW